MRERILEASSEDFVETNEPTEALQDMPKQKQLRHRCRRRSCRRITDSFATYFPRVLKLVQQGLSLSQEAVSVMDSFVKDIFERIAEEASCLVRKTQRTTITTEGIQTAVCLLLPGTLGKQALFEGNNAMIHYIYSSI